MLNKDICKACVSVRRLGGAGEIVPWNDMDDSEWDDNRASCEDLFLGNHKIDEHGASAAVDEPPPDWCPFRLEHLMAWQKC